ncbi:MAG: methyltransferase domain-containing protein [Vicinamibacterales bacterium]
MHVDLLAILRCPYCGSRLELVTSIFHRTDADTIKDGVLGCECCVFPVVDGIPVMHLHPASNAARERIEAGRPELALLAMVGLDDEAQAERFEAAIAAPSSTYKDIVEALGPGFEGGYFLYRFSDPTFIVADAVVRAVAGTVLRAGGRALDICGGSGHLTRALVPLSKPAPVLADLVYPKIWLARRFTAPGAVPVCCDGNFALPFARGSFDYAMCSDAFMFIWTKREFVGEMFRAVDGSPHATVLINHTHNQLVWSPSHGNALTPAGYRHLFEVSPAHVYGESALFADVVAGEALDLSRKDTEATLDTNAALTLIASKVGGVFDRHPLQTARTAAGEWRINPLFDVTDTGAQLQATLRFPSSDYEYEYNACREYLPESVSIDAASFHALQSGTPQPSLDELIRRKVLIDVPAHYF